MKTIKMVGSQVTVTSLMDIHVVSPNRDFMINFLHKNSWVVITSSLQFVSYFSSIQCKICLIQHCRNTHHLHGLNGITTFSVTIDMQMHTLVSELKNEYWTCLFTFESPHDESTLSYNIFQCSFNVALFCLTAKEVQGQWEDPTEGWGHLPQVQGILPGGRRGTQ